MVRPTIGRDCSCRTAATADESTPPDMAMATRPGCDSGLTGRVSNWVAVSIRPILADWRVACRKAGLATEEQSAQRKKKENKKKNKKNKKKRQLNAEAQSSQRKKKKDKKKNKKNKKKRQLNAEAQSSQRK